MFPVFPPDVLFQGTLYFESSLQREKISVHALLDIRQKILQFDLHGDLVTYNLPTKSLYSSDNTTPIFLTNYFMQKISDGDKPGYFLSFLYRIMSPNITWYVAEGFLGSVKEV